MTPPFIRVVVADDHGIVREGIRSALDATNGFEVVAEAATGVAALAAIEVHAPDVVVLDISMPEQSGLEVTAALHAARSPTRVLILSMHEHAEYVLEAIRAGAQGYLLKSAGPAQVRDAVRTVAAGRQYLPPSLAMQMGTALRNEAEQRRIADRLRELTPREREVLVRVAGGETSRSIAAELGISPRTVEAHRESIARKLDIHTVAGLTRFALETGLVKD